jgi:diguanylate cyclase (GGDEF)-like protein/PAS domain S-box-containing protein
MLSNPLEATFDEFIEQVHPADREAVRGSLERACADGGDYRVEHRVFRRDGTVAWLEQSGRVECGPNGRRVSMVGVVRDITERKRGEQRLQASDRRFRMLMESAGDGVALLDSGGKLLDWNQRFEVLAGREADALQGTGIDDFHPAPDQRHLHTLLPRLGDIGGTLSSGHLIREDGALVPVEISLTPVRWSGRVLALGIYRDLSERRDAEAYARKLSRALQQTGDSVMITDAEGRIEFVNDSFEKLTGYTRNEVIGRPPSLLQSGHHDHDFYRRLWSTVKSGAVFRDTFVNRRKDGGIYHEAKVITPLRDPYGRVTHYVATGRDISDRMHLEERLRRLAYYDALTDLPNRVLFLEQLEHSVARARRDGSGFALLFIDLDQFKGVNDTMGHAAGDRYLSQVARRLRGGLRDCDVVARMGGDEFAVLLPECAGEACAAELARRVLRMLAHPVDLNERSLYPSASLGVAVFPRDGEDAETLLKHADIAMYRAKRDGGGFQFFTQEMNDTASRRFHLENALRRAVDESEFHMEFQPQVSLPGGEVRGVEALLRWSPAELGPQSPGMFIPLLEETRLIVPLGRWILRHACETLRQWWSRGQRIPRVAVNVAPVQLEDPGFVTLVRDVLGETGVPPEALELEVVETSLMSDFDAIARTLEALSAKGVGLALDDFGTGFSALSYLRRLPVNTLKIDREFVQGIGINDTDAGLVQAMVAVGEKLGLEVVGEGVETAEQFNFLAAIGCGTGQGFHIGRPMAARALGAKFVSGPGEWVYLPPGV